MHFRRVGGHTRDVAIMLAVIVLAMSGTAHHAVADRSIYFADISGRLSLTSAQRPQVERIFGQSQRNTLQIFAKYGIDPDAKPDFAKLLNARHELQAVERRERDLLKNILNKSQLKTYDKLIQQIRARVIKATRTDQ